MSWVLAGDVGEGDDGALGAGLAGVECGDKFDVIHGTPPSPCFMVQSLRNRGFRLGLVCGLKVSNEKARLGRAAFDLSPYSISGVKGGGELSLVS